MGQVDWKEKITLCSKSGEKFCFNVFHHCLKLSRLSYFELSIRMQKCDVHRALANSFNYIGGVPEVILFDNMSTVSERSIRGPTASIARFAKDFGFEPKLCKPGSPETKGLIEARNKFIDWLRPYDGEFESLDELVGIVKRINYEINLIISQGTELSPVALFYKEKEYLHSLPSQSIITGYLNYEIKYPVCDGLIEYKKCKYSVGKDFEGLEVTLFELSNKIYIYYTGNLVVCHTKSGNKLNYTEKHYKEVMSGKVSDEVLDKTVKENLEIMDRLLEMRKITITPVEAAKSEEGIITFLNTTSSGRWTVNKYAHLSKEEQAEYVSNIGEVLPYAGPTL